MEIYCWFYYSLVSLFCLGLAAGIMQQFLLLVICLICLYDTLEATADIVPNWRLATPDPMVTVGYRCEGFPVEMIRWYRRRVLCHGRPRSARES